MRTVLIGAGNLATHLGLALKQSGFQMVQVYSRTHESASALASSLQCPCTVSLHEILPDAQFYVFAVRDAVLEELSQQLAQVLPSECPEKQGANALFVHTSGSMSLNVLPFRRRGVFYPMQTFSKERQVDFSSIPVFVESPTDEAFLFELARRVSRKVMVLNESQRGILHVAAVFACNFTNHMYHLSASLLESHGIPFEVMLPLIDETARKVHELTPPAAQTGPAVRYDTNVMQRHQERINDPAMKQIYKLLSDNIHDKLRSHENKGPLL